MGLDGAANEVLKEGLTACPTSTRLQQLAKEAGLSIPAAENVSAGYAAGSNGLEEVFTAAMRTSLTPASAASSLGGASTTAVLGTARIGDPELTGAEFWELLRSSKAGLAGLLQLRGGLIRVSDILPKEVAEETLKKLESLERSEWLESNSALYDDKGSYGDTTAKHWFFRYDGDKLDGTFRELHALAPDLFPSFQAAKYEKSGNLSAHDDSNYFQITSTDKNRSPRYPAGTLMFRKIAVIFYLTKDWRQEYGGSLMDLHDQEPKFLVPRFNSLVAFLVPRVHQVEELADGCPPRFTLFGWFSEDKGYPSLQELEKMPWLSTSESRGHL